MMRSRFEFAIHLVSSGEHLLSDVDENEYERLKILLDSSGIPDARTVVWDEKNPMLGRKGIATQHECVLWRARSNDSVYLRNINQRVILDRAREIVEKYGGVTEQARREYAKWIAAHPGPSGGEKA